MRFLTLLARIRVTTYSGSPLIQSFHAYIHMEYSLYSYPFIYIDLYSYVFITNEYTYIHDVTITNKPDSHHHHSGGDNKSEEAGVEVPPTSRETIMICTWIKEGCPWWRKSVHRVFSHHV